MSTFARIKSVATYKKVVYYSVILTDSKEEEILEVETESLFEDFLNRNQTDNRKKLTHILAWMKEIGENRGALIDDFRHEKKASALPPKGKDRKPVFMSKGKNDINDLRLYCFPVNERVVFLFNGGIKTTKKAQECPNVSTHFDIANKLVSCLDDLFLSKEISWNKEFTDIEFAEDLIFEI
ncbi:hypothetical protein H3Z85_07985 [Chryseobacterium indologenes]|uniref:hypothetical protein n=1 Tax=Chryseobacterium indologenes TaxID=253 RepID=UPI0003E07323|nr:hypothetical protein [Chryseobacterium indologenes]QPQ53277.1 hypothetical protein H3Z85_07985 [Chryseobacterium indologenes]GAE63573.1 hypothetical protein CIN01S_04_01790 [Chryseobacterium indologenes NBRC 14944]SFJ64479.1 hypothetical protein SAMN05421692_2236 [Chryseobacterium indologenes]SUX52099.1 Uncharacterised protein [Chryseobacterium indologenes]